MKIHLLPVGMIQTNCYIVESSQKNAMIIDPGDNPAGILSFCERAGLTIKMLVFTHGHYDHIGATTVLVEKTGAKKYIHALDEELLLNPNLIREGQLAAMKGYQPAKADCCYADGERLTLDDISLTVMHTPGHTKGSCVLIGDGIIFTGDTIFAGTVGRTDLYGGDEMEMLHSAKKVAAIKGNYTLLCGHGETAELSNERITNPFMGTNYDDVF